jgi:plasmid stabilization system protein ParE
MRLHFTPDAVEDLRSLREWLMVRSPGGYRHVVLSITRTIRVLDAHPEAGRPTERANIRELIERRYGFILPYTVIGDSIWILRVYNARRAPHDMLRPPPD